jgi:hypothetical protein
MSSALRSSVISVHSPHYMVVRPGPGMCTCHVSVSVCRSRGAQNVCRSWTVVWVWGGVGSCVGGAVFGFSPLACGVLKRRGVCTLNCLFGGRYDKSKNEGTSRQRAVAFVAMLRFG